VRRPRTRRAAALTALAIAASVAGVSCAQPGDRTPTGTPGGASASAEDPLLGPADPATGSPVRVGLFNVEDNPLSDLRSTGDAAEAAATYANEHLGGLAGHPIEVVRCADKVDVATAKACADEFVRTGVVAVVAGQPTTSDAVLPTTVAAGIPWVGSSPVSQSEVGSDNAFFFGPGALGNLGAYAQYSADLGYRNVVIYGVDTPELNGLIQTVGKAIFARAGIGMRLVSVPPGPIDATDLVEQGLAGKPDAVLVLSESTVCRSVMSALQKLGATQPRLVGTACADRGVVDTLGESALDNSVVFGVGDPSGLHPEARDYRAVMQQYAPGDEPTGMTTFGYVSMLGLIRAVNAAGLPEGQVTGERISAALRAARDVPRPLGNSSTFSCDKSRLSSRLVKATICTSEVLYATYTGGVAGRYNKIDVAPIYGS
jgi:branched-chain amino acid transport system substrate-binding protein